MNLGTFLQQAPGALVFLGFPDSAERSALDTAFSRLTEGSCFSDVQQFRRAAAAAPDAPLLLIWETARAQLLRGGQAGRDPQAELVVWQQQAQELLALFRAFRRRARMVSSDAALAAPELLPEPLPERPGQPGAADPLLALIVEEVLRRDHGAVLLDEELEASSLPFDPGGAGAAAPDAAFRDYRRAGQLAVEHAALGAGLARKEQDLREAREETEALLAELSRNQAMAVQGRAQAARAEVLEREAAEAQLRLAALGEDLSRSQAQLHQLRQGLESSEAQVATLQTETVRLAAEARLARRDADNRITEQGRRFQEQLRERQQQEGRLAAELTRKTAELARKTAEISRKNAQISGFYNSRSYRLTAPLRWLSARLGGRGRK